MDKIFRALNLYSSTHGLLSPKLRNPTFLIPLSYFHGRSKIPAADSELEFDFRKAEIRSSKLILERTQIPEAQFDRRETTKARELKVQLDPWPEWVEFMECLSEKGYFERDGVRFLNADLGAKELNHIRTACLNFARDRFNLIRYLSGKELQMITGSGCPSIDRKVVNSGKRLRAYVGIDEGNVCSSCHLRGECERAFVKARVDEGARTVDVVRILLFYGLNHVSTTVENRSYTTKKANNAARKLLKQIVEYSSDEHEADMLSSNSATSAEYLPDRQESGNSDASMKPGDWHCPKCNFLNFSRNTKCLRCGSLLLERLRKLHEDQVDLPLKKGDWICDKCNFLNFAKNSRCLQCKEKPSNRQLSPGEWECESCNYLNFRKNALCLRCDHKRPKALNSSAISAGYVVENGRYNFSELRISSAETGGNDNLRDSSGKTDDSMWRFVEKDGEDCGDFQDLRFLNFRAAGDGERWKSKRFERRKRMLDSTEKEDELILRSNNFERKLELTESSDDEGMAEWFGHHKPKS